MPPGGLGVQTLEAPAFGGCPSPCPARACHGEGLETGMGSTSTASDESHTFALPDALNKSVAPSQKNRQKMALSSE